MASSSRIEPGGKGSIVVAVDTLYRRGIIVKTVEVFSNDPKRPRVVLTLQADVQEKK